MPVGTAAGQPRDPGAPGGAQPQHPAPCPALAAQKTTLQSSLLCGWWPLSGGSPRARVVQLWDWWGWPAPALLISLSLLHPPCNCM